MIQFIRTYLLNAYSALPLLACLLLAGWSSQANSMPAKAAHPYSGEAMFRGLFFLEGPYAEAIPELQSLQQSYGQKLAKVADKEKVRSVRNQLIKAIKLQHPHYFDQFQADLTSGNYVRTKAAIEAAQKLCITTAEAMPMGKSAPSTAPKTDPNSKTCVYILIIVNVFINQISVFAVAMPLPPVIGEEYTQSKSTLLMEQLVASIARLSLSAS